MASQSLLITQCLQNDFVKPIGRYDRMPNLLHIGHDEARRLLGDEPATGPIARIMNWAHTEGREHVRVIHIRDWHDPTDPWQAAHLAQFGDHCIQNTEGADFVFTVPDQDKQIAIVNSISLNDFTHTSILDHLHSLDSQDIPVGLMGVWTDAKIFFLAYELITRFPQMKVGVCSALTASSSRAQHFIALDQLRKILGVYIFDSVGSFAEFLGGSMPALPAAHIAYQDQLVVSFDGETRLSAVDDHLLRYLFRQSRSVRGRILDGGFSGNVVLGTRSTDAHGHEEVSHVVKIGPAEQIGRERASFEQVEAVLGNCAPRIVDAVDLEGRGALKYRYASMDGAPATTLQKLYVQEAPLEVVERILKTVFHEQLGRFYAAAKLEARNLMEYYEFSARFAPGIRRRVEGLLGHAVGSEATFELEGRSIPNLCRFYEDQLEPLPVRRGDTCYFAFVHGDLNGANIIIDGRENVWIIDYFHTHRGHVLRDLIKLENDLLFIFTPLSNEVELQQAFLFSNWLLEVEDLGVPLPRQLPASITHPPLVRAAYTVTLLRSFYPRIIHADRDPLQWFIAALRYAVHTLSFDESNIWQKKWALYSAARYSERIIDKYHSVDLLRIDWVPEATQGPGGVGITLLPGRRDFGRDLSHDIETMVNQGVTHVVCLVPSDELERYDVAQLLTEYSRVGLKTCHLPIVDQGVVPVSEVVKTLRWMHNAVEGGKRVVVHCAGGLGRAGTIVACYLKYRGVSSDAAIAAVRSARSPRAIESAEQMEFVRSFSIEG